MTRQNSRPLDTEKIENILIRSTNWIGDAVMTTPAVRAVRKNFPDARISILVKPWVAPVFEDSPHVDETIAYETSGKRGVLSMVKGLEKRRFDAAILLQNAFEAALVAFLSKIPVRIGYDRDARHLLLTHPMPCTRRVRSLHQTQYYNEILRGVGLVPDGPRLELYFFVRGQKGRRGNSAALRYFRFRADCRCQPQRHVRPGEAVVSGAIRRSFRQIASRILHAHTDIRRPQGQGSRPKGARNDGIGSRRSLRQDHSQASHRPDRQVRPFHHQRLRPDARRRRVEHPPDRHLRLHRPCRHRPCEPPSQNRPKLCSLLTVPEAPLPSRPHGLHGTNPDRTSPPGRPPNSTLNPIRHFAGKIRPARMGRRILRKTSRNPVALSSAAARCLPSSIAIRGRADVEDGATEIRTDRKIGPGLEKCSNSNFGCLWRLQGNQTILVWFGASGNSTLLRACQTRMAWLPWSLQPIWHGIYAKIRIAGRKA